MKIRLLVVLGIICSCLSLVSAQDLRPTAEQLEEDERIWSGVPTVVETPGPSPSGWIVYVDKQQRFSVSFPTKPAEGSRTEQGVTAHSFSAQDGDLTYVLVFGTFKKSLQDNPDDFDLGMNVSMKKSLTKLGFEFQAIPLYRVKYLGLKGRQTRYVLTDRFIIARSFVHPLGGLTLTVAGPNSQFDGRVSAFMNSLQIGTAIKKSR